MISWESTDQISVTCETKRTFAPYADGPVIRPLWPPGYEPAATDIKETEF